MEQVDVIQKACRAVAWHFDILSIACLDLAWIGLRGHVSGHGSAETAPEKLRAEPAIGAAVVLARFRRQGYVSNAQRDGCISFTTKEGAHML